MMMLLPPDPPSGRLGFGCGWWVAYWLLATAEIVAAGTAEEVVTETLHGCWGSWIVSKDVVFWTVTILFEEVIEEGGPGGIGSVGSAAIVTPAGCDRCWLFINTCTVVGVEEDNAEDDDNFE